VVNGYVQFGWVKLSRLGTLNAAWVRILVTVNTGFSRAKQYQLAWEDGLPLATWFKLLPLADSSPGSADDFDVEAREVQIQDGPGLPTYTALELRLRRTAGTTAATAAVRVETNGAFEAENVTGTDSSVLALFGSTVLTQASGKVGVGTANPVAKLHVEGQLAGSVGTNDGNARVLVNLDTNNNPSIELHRGKDGFAHGFAMYIDWAYLNDSDNNVRWIIYPAAYGNEIRFQGWQHTFEAPLKVLGNVGFFGAFPIPKPTVTGSRGGNEALASLLTRFDELGLINNSTSA
jgi:hypothetical protein